MARETINGISVPIPGTGEPANFQGELRSFATDLSASIELKVGTDAGDQTTDIGAALAVEFGTSSLAGLVQKCDAGDTDATLLVLSDSTAAAANSWLNKAAPLLAARFPHLTVKTYGYTDGSPGSYAAATTVATGTGTRTLHIYNASVAGKTWQYHFDTTRWPVMISAIDPDAVVVSLGHNDNPAAVNGNNVVPQRTKAVAFLEFLRTITSSARIVLMSQNPLLVTNPLSSQYRAAMLRSLSQTMGYGFIDVCRTFEDDPRPITDLVSGDNVHPTDAGYTLWAERFMAEFAPQRTQVPASPVPAFAVRGRNLITDPTFANYDGSTAPVNGTAPFEFTNATHAKDTTNYETGTWGFKVTKAAAGVSCFDVPLPIALVKGRVVTVVARLRVPTASGVNAGQVAVRTAAGVPGSEVWGQYDQFIYRVMTAKVSSSAAWATARVFVDPASGGSAGPEITVDRIGAYIGDVPFDPTA